VNGILRVKKIARAMKLDCRWHSFSLKHITRVEEEGGHGQESDTLLATAGGERELFIDNLLVRNH